MLDLQLYNFQPLLSFFLTFRLDSLFSSLLVLHKRLPKIINSSTIWFLNLRHHPWVNLLFFLTAAKCLCFFQTPVCTLWCLLWGHVCPSRHGRFGLLLIGLSILSLSLSLLLEFLSSGVSYVLCSQWVNNVKALFFHPSPFFLVL